MTLSKIQESLAEPSTVSFWQLPHFIKALDATGFPSTRHRLHYQALWAQPFFLGAMALFAAAFSLRLTTRQSATLQLVIGGIFAGCFVFAMNAVVLALGASQTLPIILAAWTAPVVSLCLGITALFYLEDG